MVKSLRSTGSSARVARVLEIGDRPAEVRRVGEDGKRSGTAGFVRLGRRARSRSGASSPFDGDRRLISAITATRPSARRNAAREGSSRRGLEGVATQQVTGLRLPEHRHFVAFGREDLVENGHSERDSTAAPALNPRFSQRFDAAVHFVVAEPHDHVGRRFDLAPHHRECLRPRRCS